MPKRPEFPIDILRKVRIIDLGQPLRNELYSYCDELDDDIYPESTKLVKGKYKTLLVFGKMIKRMKPRTKDARKGKKILIAVAELIQGNNNQSQNSQTPEVKEGHKDSPERREAKFGNFKELVKEKFNDFKEKIKSKINLREKRKIKELLNELEIEINNENVSKVTESLYDRESRKKILEIDNYIMTKVIKNITKHRLSQRNETNKKQALFESIDEIKQILKKTELNKTFKGKRIANYFKSYEIEQLTLNEIKKIIEICTEWEKTGHPESTRYRKYIQHEIRHPYFQSKNIEYYWEISNHQSKQINPIEMFEIETKEQILLLDHLSQQFNLNEWSRKGRLDQIFNLSSPFSENEQDYKKALVINAKFIQGLPEEHTSTNFRTEGDYKSKREKIIELLEISLPYIKSLEDLTFFQSIVHESKLLSEYNNLKVDSTFNIFMKISKNIERKNWREVTMSINNFIIKHGEKDFGFKKQLRHKDMIFENISNPKQINQLSKIYSNKWTYDEHRLFSTLTTKLGFDKGIEIFINFQELELNQIKIKQKLINFYLNTEENIHSLKNLEIIKKRLPTILMNHNFELLGNSEITNAITTCIKKCHHSENIPEVPLVSILNYIESTADIRQVPEMRKNLKLITQNIVKIIEMEKDLQNDIGSIPLHSLPSSLTLLNQNNIILLNKFYQHKDIRNSKDKQKSMRNILLFGSDNATDEFRSNLSFTFKIAKGKTILNLMEYVNILNQINFLKKQPIQLTNTQTNKHQTIEKYREWLKEQFIEAAIEIGVSSPIVQTKLANNLEQYFKTDLFKIIFTLRGKFEKPYPELIPVVEAIFSATIMNDFTKLKSHQQILPYLPSEVKSKMSTLEKPLSFINKSQQKIWIDGLTTTTNKNETAINLSNEDINKDFQNQLSDLRYHITLSLQDIKFGSKGEKQIKTTLLEIQKNKEKKEYIELPEWKLKRKILSFVSEINNWEKLDFASLENNNASKKKMINMISQTSKKLVYILKNRNFTTEQIASLQAKTDLEILTQQLKHGQRTNIKSGIITIDTSNEMALLESGTQPANSGSCQAYDRTPSLMRGLMGYITHPFIKKIESKDAKTGQVLGRAMIRVVEITLPNGEIKPALQLERGYWLDKQRDIKVENAIWEHAKTMSKQLSMPIFSNEWNRDEPNKKQIKLTLKLGTGISRYQYLDSAIGDYSGVADFHHTNDKLSTEYPAISGKSTGILYNFD